MENITFHLDVVSAVGSLYSGRVRTMRITGSEGEMGIRHGHAPLLTTIKAGMVLLTTAEGKEDQFYLAGGLLEVQPDSVTVLADTALRADDIDEAKAKEAMREAQAAIKHQSGDKDYNKAFAQLAEAMAQLKVIELSRSTRRK
ncbi:F0F1 ATP synthase subunit epsilon [Succinatimonas hippei]|uniref:F0F1 ATP synthase subunit epsilon n=1 Tax=Succinatimonas hippei TaxID=626938 RepID=UPI00201368AD|nr:F0F1 ATP synthase subunit epsilon [Succinatimonas hippei]MCL1602872.1 F0F1 ATP synthase subunit epsilon [Succinatimonas hippei]